MTMQQQQQVGSKKRAKVRVRINRKSQGRLPKYNLQQIENWVNKAGQRSEYSDDDDDDDDEEGGYVGWEGGRRESEEDRLFLYQKLCMLLTKLNSKINTRPGLIPTCRCEACASYRSWLVQEALMHGYEVKIIPDHKAHTGPVHFDHRPLDQNEPPFYNKDPDRIS